MPKGWQFLWIDVPSTPDLLDPGTGVKPLPNKYYLPLSGDGLTYSQVDGAIMQNKGGDLFEEMAQWSPDPSRVNVPISDGAGQYRAIGRVVTMSKFVFYLFKRCLVVYKYIYNPIPRKIFFKSKKPTFVYIY